MWFGMVKTLKRVSNNGTPTLASSLYAAQWLHHRQTQQPLEVAWMNSDVNLIGFDCFMLCHLARCVFRLVWIILI